MTGFNPSGRILTGGLAVITNIFSDTAVGIAIGFTDQTEILLVLSIEIAILWIHFNKFVKHAMLRDGKLDGMDKVFLKFINYVYIGIVFVVLHLFLALIKDAIFISPLKWYELIAVGGIIIPISFAVIQKYVDHL